MDPPPLPSSGPENALASSSMVDVSQETEPASQHSVQADPECWGVLLPARQGEERVRLLKSQWKYTVGRDPGSDLVLRSKHISLHHATIEWDGVVGIGCSVKLRNISRYAGTHIGGTTLKPNESALIRDGQKVIFGSMRVPRQESDPEPSVYIFRNFVAVRRLIDTKYTVQGEIGAGNFAQVYKALPKQSGPKDMVAVKTISLTKLILATNKGLTGLRKEVDILKRLQGLKHPNIIQFIEHFENEDNSIDIVTELLAGGDLDAYILYHDEVGLSDWMTCHFTYQITSAVAFMHGHNIFHRDLKPANILLTAQSPPIVKVADFGVSKIREGGTDLRTVCGTFQYMAPELVLRWQEPFSLPYTGAIDCWSLGALIFTMYTNETVWPSEGDGAQGVYNYVVRHKPNDGVRWELIEGRKKVSAAGRDFMKCLLQYNPENRMSMADAREHPWLANFKPPYDMGNPQSESQASTGAADDGGSSQPHAFVREQTVDPNADEDEQPGPSETAAAVLADPYHNPTIPAVPSSRSKRGSRAAAPAPAPPSPGPAPARTRLSDIPEASESVRGSSDLYAPTPTTDKGKGKAKATPEPVLGSSDLYAPAPSTNKGEGNAKAIATPALTRNSDGNDTMFLYGSDAPPPPGLGPAPTQMDVDAPRVPKKVLKRKREDDEVDLLALAMGGRGDDLSSLSTIGSGDASMVLPRTPAPAAADAPGRVTRAGSASARPPAKRGRTKAPTPSLAELPEDEPAQSSRPPRKPPSVRSSKPPSRSSADAPLPGRATRAKTRAASVAISEDEGRVASGSGAAVRPSARPASRRAPKKRT
ncbi:hypothetical protein MKEN_00741900 [Mycena kentingensis (nom. inval.)]|nr:hypothetical protein MKEN_00741900 [Mycena kentingensis (nom. inval.)]